MARHISFFIVLWFSFVTYTICDISLLRNKFHVLCFSEDENTVAFLSPPTLQRKNIKYRVENVTWQNDDWVQISTNESITDLRWTEFETNSSNHLVFSSDEAISFWVFAPFKFSLFISLDDTPIRTLHSKSVEEGSGGWYHFDLLQKNGSLELHENEKIVNSSTWKNIPPRAEIENVTVTNTNETFWKIQDLKIRWSNTTTEDKPTRLKIPSSEKLCLTVYYSLCENCYLEINSITLTKHNYTTKNQSNMWYSSEIRLQSGEENIIDIYRRTFTNDVNGTWGLDLRYCRDFKDTIVGTNISHNEECKFLNYEATEMHIINSSNDTALCEEPGKIGNNCQKNCSEVLGSNFTYCEHHVICRNSNCFCAWGSYGDQCEKSCTDGTYGLNCTNRCENCNDCNKITGKCFAPDIDKSSNHTALIILIILITILVVLGIICYKFREKIKFLLCRLRQTSTVHSPESESRAEHDIPLTASSSDN